MDYFLQRDSEQPDDTSNVGMPDTEFANKVKYLVLPFEDVAEYIVLTINSLLLIEGGVDAFMREAISMINEGGGIETTMSLQDMEFNILDQATRLNTHLALCNAQSYAMAMEIAVDAICKELIDAAIFEDQWHSLKFMRLMHGKLFISSKADEWYA